MTCIKSLNGRSQRTTLNKYRLGPVNSNTVNLKFHLIEISAKIFATFLSLPPASEGWGKVLFSVCLSVHILGGGTPVRSGGGVPHPRSGEGGTPSQVWPEGGTPSQVWMGIPPWLDLGWGTPWPDLGWVSPQPDLELGTPHRPGTR